MKELNGIAFGKGLFVSIKEQLCMTKGHMYDQEGQVVIAFPSSEVVFDTFDSN